VSDSKLVGNQVGSLDSNLFEKSDLDPDLELKQLVLDPQHWLQAAKFLPYLQIF
jgi:hypothetical protein